MTIDPITIRIKFLSGLGIKEFTIYLTSMFLAA